MSSSICYLFVIPIMLWISCASQQVSVIEGATYDEGEDQTEYFVLPYGTVKIPGKWDKTRYNGVSRQQFFSNADSIEIALAFVPYDKYPFNVDGSQKGFDFVKAFYEWDSKYFIETYGLNRQIVAEDSLNQYIIWRLYGTKNQEQYDSYFLFGEKNGNVSNFSVMATDQWQEPFKVKFLRDLYFSRNKE